MSSRFQYYGGLGPAIAGVSCTLFCIGTILVSLRIYTHFTIVKRSGGWALIWACVAYTLGVPSVILYVMAALDGLGNHLKIVATDPYLADSLLYEWIAACTISFSVGFAKLSAMCYILDVQRRTHGYGRWALFVFVGGNFICYIVTVPLIFTQCTPTAGLWNMALGADCSGINRGIIWAEITGAWGAATDLLLALYPVFIIYNLQIQLRLKIILCFLMGLGVFTAICSLVKTAQFNRLEISPDATYEIAPLMIWGMTEMWIVLIASSVAPLWPLLRLSASRLTQHHRSTDHSLFSGPVFSRRKFTGHSSRDDDDNGSRPTGGITAHGDAFRKLGSRNTSQEAMVTADGIKMTHDITVRHEPVGGRGAESPEGFGGAHGKAVYAGDMA
ncbi:hypothetical protein MMC32_003606 [Xylographa parallela]|nr:hypothetical protein [Xylographa parallela]